MVTWETPYGIETGVNVCLWQFCDGVSYYLCRVFCDQDVIAGCVGFP